MLKRKLFCEISPIAYKISAMKCRLIRHIRDIFSGTKLAKQKISTKLPILVYKNNSLIRRKLGNTDLNLQENKAINLALSAPRVSGILIKPGETFSFWRLVGKCSAKKGYKEGLTISSGKATKGIGGGLCQFTNMIHWLVLHTPLDIVEHHHHDGMDLFPDYGRQIPFGTGTSICYNYIDYRFKNNTAQTYQLIVYTCEKYLHGEIRTTDSLAVQYHIKAEDEGFVEENGDVFRVGKIYRECVDKATGNIIEKELIKINNAKVMYDVSDLLIANKA